MKRTLLFLMVVATAAAAAFAISPREAFTRISQLYGMQQTTRADIVLDASKGYRITNVQNVEPFTGTDNRDLRILDIASQITPDDQLIGAYNPYIAAEVYTCPDTTGQYDYLLLVYNKSGVLYFCQLGTISDGGRQYIANSDVHLKDNTVKISLAPDLNLVNIWDD